MIKELKENIQLQEIGAIKIGKKGELKTSKYGKQFQQPVKFDYFTVVTKEKDATGNFIVNKKVMDKLGEKPTSLDIKLLYDDIEQNYYTYYGLYRGRKCLCRGDGEKAIRTKKDGTEEEVVCDRKTCEFAKIDDKGTRRCKANGKLQVILLKSDVVGGAYIFRTTSWNTHKNLIASMLLVQNRTGGILAGIPLKLTVQPKTTIPEGQTASKTVYVVNIIYPESEDRLIETAVNIAERRKVAGIQLKEIQKYTQHNLLTSPETEEEIRDVVAEYYPEAQGDFVEYVDPDEFEQKQIPEEKSESDEINEVFDDDVPLPNDSTQDNNKQPEPQKNGNGKGTTENLFGEDNDEEDLLVSGVM